MVKTRLRKPGRFVLLSLARCFLVAAGIMGQAGAAETSAEREAFFEKNVRPLLADQCFKCHGPEKQEAGLRLDLRAAAFQGGESGPAIRPGSPRESLLVKAILHQDGLQMPPKGKLDQRQIAAIVQWIRAGAAWPEDHPPAGDRRGLKEEQASFWSFQPISQPQPPVVKDQQWARSDVDRFVLGRLEAAGLRPAAAASKRVLLRRASFDLTGLPPTPEQLEAFLEDDSPDAFARVVDRLLASRAYGERWGRHWLDVVRYADTAGETADFPAPHAWRYRNYVIDAFAQDKPFDQFLREQLAGDIIAGDDPRISDARYAELVTATGFLAISRRFGFDARKDHYLTIEDTIDTLGKSFLGLTLACARCHDHKYDPISVEDYYGLYGIMASTRYAFPGSEKDKKPADLAPLARANDLEQRLAQQAQALEERIKRLQEESKRASQQFASLLRPAGRMLVEGRIGRGEEQPIDAKGVEVKRGEMLRLTVDPSGEYGADSTLVQWEVHESGGEQRIWKLTDDVIDNFLVANPHPDRIGNALTWCFLDARQPGVLLEQGQPHEDHPGLLVWRTDPLPSVFINAGRKPVQAWTALPPRSLFVHPASDGPVAIGWTSPCDGVVAIRGRVADAHPTGGNGVGWRIDLFRGDFLEALNKPKAGIEQLQEATRQLDELRRNKPQIEYAYAVAEGSPANARIHKRGDPRDLGADVPRKNIDLLGGQKVVGQTSGRLQLADWIVAPDNPLTARVLANRVWQHHFGRGLVDSPNDFGAQGQRPSHPELLDWLAKRLIAQGWSVKAMHRLIMLSKTYQLASADHDARQPLFGAFARRRLSAEEIRDSLLFVGGGLDQRPGGPHPFPPEATWGYTQHSPFRADYEHSKRSVYLMTQRIQTRPWMTLFDGPDPSSSTGRRLVSTSPAQSLYFMNGELLHQQAAALAKRVRKDAMSPAESIALAHRLALTRDANAVDVREALAFLAEYQQAATAEQAWAAWCRVLLSSNEFLYVD